MFTYRTLSTHELKTPIARLLRRNGLEENDIAAIQFGYPPAFTFAPMPESQNPVFAEVNPAVIDAYLSINDNLKVYVFLHKNTDKIIDPGSGPVIGPSRGWRWVDDRMIHPKLWRLLDKYARHGSFIDEEYIEIRRDKGDFYMIPMNLSLMLDELKSFDYNRNTQQFQITRVQYSEDGKGTSPIIHYRVFGKKDVKTIDRQELLKFVNAFLVEKRVSRFINYVGYQSNYSEQIDIEFDYMKRTHVYSKAFEFIIREVKDKPYSKLSRYSLDPFERTFYLSEKLFNAIEPLLIPDVKGSLYGYQNGFDDATLSVPIWHVLSMMVGAPVSILHDAYFQTYSSDKIYYYIPAQ